MSWYCLATFCCLVAAASQVNCHENLLIDQLRTEFLILEDELWEYVLDQHKNHYVDSGLYLIEKFHSFDIRLKQMPEDLLNGMDVARQAKEFLLFYSDLRIISDTYDKFRRYQLTNMEQTRKDYSEYKREITTSDIVDDILHDTKNNVNKTIWNIHRQMFGTGQAENLFYEVFGIVASSDYNCKNPYQPKQQVFYNLYNTLALIDLKGYVMTQFAYMSQRLQGTGNYTESSLIARKQYETRLNSTASSLRGVMEVIDGSVWRCDPKIHVKGATYDQLTRLLQGHLQNEVDLNDRNTCRESCGAYTFAKGNRCYDRGSNYCRERQPCLGNLINCQFIESDMTACLSPPRSLRRYEYIEYKSGRTMGEMKFCYDRKVNSWWRWFVHCSTCLCLCDEQGPLSDRYFNLRPVKADVENNRVVTGLRLIKYNRIIHLQIQEGKLLPHGFIDNTTVRWVPVDDYHITDPGIKNGLDFHTMDFERRTLIIDELEASDDQQIVTGVQFEYTAGNLRFLINVSPFNFTTGVVSLNSHDIHSTGYGDYMNMDNLAIPTESPPSEPTWKPKGYLYFTNTGFYTDVAQTTVPFFDTQPVTSYPQLPLRGAALYYKGKPGYGGFIAPKITTYDFTQRMIVDFPKANEREDASKELEVIPQ